MADRFTRSPHVKLLDSADVTLSLLTIVPHSDTTVVTGTTTFRLDGVGTYEVPLLVEAAPVNRGRPLDQLRFAFAFDIKPIRLPPHVTYDPPVLNIREDALRPPDPVVTLVTVQPTSISPPRWVGLPNLAVFDADVRLAVRGPLPPDCRLAFQAPRSVSKLDLSLATIPSQDESFRRTPVDAMPPLEWFDS